MLVDGHPANNISLDDRGLAYGDGLFETIRFQDRRLLFLAGHLERLRKGCQVLGLSFESGVLQAELAQALEQGRQAHGVLKLVLTRAPGGRGYRPGAGTQARRIITLHPLPEYPQQWEREGVAAFVCRQRLGLQPTLAGFKHLNRLEQVLASAEWPDDSFQEGLMLDLAGRVVEGTRSNLFLVSDGRLRTPALLRCGVAGVLREQLLAYFGDVGIDDISLAELLAAEEVFLCNSVFGVWPLRRLLHPGGERQWQPGAHAARAAALFREALAA